VNIQMTCRRVRAMSPVHIPRFGKPIRPWARHAPKAGPIERRAVRLVKLALAIGASSEGAVHSHVRRAIDEGISTEEIKQVALLAIPTLGFPQAVRVLTWIEDITDK